MRSYVITGDGGNRAITTPFGNVSAIGRVVAWKDVRGTALVNGLKDRRRMLGIGAGPFEEGAGHEGGHDGDLEGGDDTGGDGGSGGGIDWVKVGDAAINFFTWMFDVWGPNYDPENGGEIKRQLMSTTPRWADIMIARYISWLDQQGKLEPRYSGTGDIWADDGYSPSRFFDKYLLKFGSTDVSTGASQYPFPQGRPGSGGGDVDVDVDTDGGARPDWWGMPGQRGWDEASHTWLPGYGPTDVDVDVPPTQQAGMGAVVGLLFAGVLLMNADQLLPKPRRR